MYGSQQFIVLGFLMVPLLLGAVICAYLAIRTIRSKRGAASLAFGISMALAAHWAFFYSLEIALDKLWIKLILAKIEYIGIVFVPVAWVAFAAELENIQAWVKNRWRWISIIVIIPIVTVLMVFSNNWLHNVFWTNVQIRYDVNFPPMFVAEYGWWFQIHFIYSYTLLLSSSIILITYMVRRTQSLYRWQLALALFAVLVPWLANVVYFLPRIFPAVSNQLSLWGIRPFFNVDSTPLMFGISGLALSVSIFRFRMLEVMPIARQTVMNNISDAMLLFDSLGRLIDLNPVAKRVLNLGTQDPIGRNVTELFKFNEALLSLYQRTESFPSQAEIFFYAPDVRPDVPYSLQYFDVHLSSIQKEKRELGRLMLLHNITARKEMEDALRRNQEELERRVLERTTELQTANDALQLEVRERQKYEQQLQKERHGLQERVDSSVVELRATNQQLAHEIERKDEILAMLNHELRTPLNAILGMTQYLKSGSENATRQQQAVDTIENNSLTLLQMVNDLLDLANISLREVRIENLPVSIDQICRASLQTVQLPALEKNITVRYVPDERVKNMLGDANYLRRILTHLLQNAVKFTPQNGRVALGVKAYPDAKRVHIVVGDTGVGIEPSELPYLFRPALQMEGGRNRRYAGLGMGLVLVKRLVELHNGTISVNSKPGQGTYFTIALPWEE